MEAANIAKDGWAVAEAMQKSMGSFSTEDESNTKKLREAEERVRKEKAEASRRLDRGKPKGRGEA